MDSKDSPTFVPRRTVQACSQCRARKQKCGGPTESITCAVCKRRRVACSFDTEARDPRFAPYLLPHRDIGRTEGDVASELVIVRQRLRELEEVSRRHNDSAINRSSSNISDFASNQPLWEPPRESPSTAVQNASPHSSVHRNSASQLLSLQRQAPSPTNGFAGPMRVLHDMGAADTVEMENHHPVANQVLTMGEVQVCFRIFFNKCFANAPFLDVVYDSDPLSVETRSIALLLNIVAVGARFWGQSSGTDTWLHPRYCRLIDILDKEMSRLIFRPRPSDSCIETIQAKMLYSHWMPIDDDGISTRSRFTESSAWQCLGLAIRWATGMGLDRSVHAMTMSNAEEVRMFRTMAYLTESDHYLAISARCSPTLGTHDLVHALPRFLKSKFCQATDLRLASLLRTAHAAHVMEDRAASLESVEAFNFDVDQVEKDFLSSAVGSLDTMSQHFPFTSLRWYRLAFASTLLPASDSWNLSPALKMSIAWASQILSHLSSNPESTGNLDLDIDLVNSLSFAIDQYFVVVAYAASFLVLAWREGAIDPQLETAGTPQPVPAVQGSTLYRLVDLAARMLERSSPAKGHLGSRYVSFLQGLASMLLVQQQTAAPTEYPTLDWNQDWSNLWVNSGLEQGWLFGTFDNLVGSDS